MNHPNENLPIIQTNLLADDDQDGVTSPLIVQTHLVKNSIDNDGLTCDTVVVKNEHEVYDDELLSSENDVTIHQSSTILNHSPLLPRNNTNEDFRIRSKSDGHTLKELTANYLADNKSLR